ncbi:ketopantoate reductase family protein [Anaerofustis sp.]|uniref:ketopantoate reductase family protein n=1 Tax=Anaerofustis sp. TaxID=1872517 RepID=UPI0025BC747D|nr:2-dehydropantoate 2-reductase N-terminal domain-containing protein [Anaerofustis sp.]
MKILILGLGPIGSVYGYVFKKAGHDVTHFIREEKRSKVEETLKVKLFDIRYNKKGKSKEDEYNIELMQDREFDFIFISVSPRKVKDAVDTINKNSIKGTIVFFNCLYMEREDIESIVKGNDYIVAYPLVAGCLDGNVLDAVIFDHIVAQKKGESKVKNYNGFVSLFASCDIYIENPFDMLEWNLVYMGVSAGFISSAGSLFDLRDVKNTFLSVINSNKALSYAFNAIKEIVFALAKRGIKPINYKNILSSYNSPPKIAGMIIRRNIRNNECMKRMFCLNVDFEDLLFVVLSIYDLCKEENVECPLFYKNCEIVKEKYCNR